MRLIKCMTHYMEDEICGCIEYAKEALEYQYDKPVLAKIFFQLAQTEYSHYQILHEQTVQLVNELQAQGRTYPAAMYDKWQVKHNKLIEKAEEAQTFMNMFK